MNIDDLRKKIRIIIFGILGIIIAILLIRIVLIFLGANQATGFMQFWNTISMPIISIFEGVYNKWLFGTIKIETASLLAIIVYTILALIGERIISAFFQSKSSNILIYFFDSLFKLVEFILLLRFFLRITGADSGAPFSNFLFYISSFVYQPFRNILPGFSFGDRGEYVFETSTIIALVIIIIFDVISDGILRNLFQKNEKFFPEQSPAPTQPSISTTVHQPIPQQNQQPMRQNITINVPEQGQKVIVTEDRQYVNIPQSPNRMINQPNREDMQQIRNHPSNPNSPLYPSQSSGQTDRSRIQNNQYPTIDQNNPNTSHNQRDNYGRKHSGN